MLDFIGRNSISNLSSILQKEHSKTILAFTGKTSYQAMRAIIEKELIGCEIQYYTHFSTNPKKEEIDIAIKNITIDADIILAIGGGSVIDFAKAYRFYTKPITLIAIPTTCGTGSEATQFAVVYINGVKHSLDDPAILPNYAIVDSQFVENNPTYLKACTAMDAFCQAIESYWAIQSTEESQRYAREAIILCKEHIIDYVTSSNSRSAEKMALASHLAGKAINISRTTAAHALSYIITSKYGIPHGHAVALSMIDVFIVNQNAQSEDCRDVRGYDFVQNKISEILHYIHSTDFRAYWTQLSASIHLELDLEKNGINNVTDILHSVNVERLANNPFDISKYLPYFYTQ